MTDVLTHEQTAREADVEIHNKRAMLKEQKRQLWQKTITECFNEVVAYEGSSPHMRYAVSNKFPFIGVTNYLYLDANTINGVSYEFKLYTAVFNVCTINLIITHCRDNWDTHAATEHFHWPAAGGSPTSDTAFGFLYNRIIQLVEDVALVSIEEFTNGTFGYV